MCVSLAGLLAVLALLIYFSARVMKPFSDNYEKQKRFITDAMVLLSRMEEEQKREMMVEFLLSDVAEEMVSAFQAPALVHGKVLHGAIMPMISMKGDENAIRGSF